MTVRVQMHGMRELERNLDRLKRSTRKAVGRRALKKAAVPMAQLAADLAPYDQGDLEEGVTATHRLSRAAKAKHPRPPSSVVEMFVGASNLPQAHLQEFGTVHHAPRPFLRPAWESDREALLERLRDQLHVEVMKSIARVAARAGR